MSGNRTPARKTVKLNELHKMQQSKYINVGASERVWYYCPQCITAVPLAVAVRGQQQQQQQPRRQIVHQLAAADAAAALPAMSCATRLSLARRRVSALYIQDCLPSRAIVSSMSSGGSVEQRTEDRQSSSLYSRTFL